MNNTVNNNDREIPTTIRIFAALGVLFLSLGLYIYSVMWGSMLGPGAAHPGEFWHHPESLGVRVFCLLVLSGCVGLLFLQRWGAVLLCAYGWYMVSVTGWRLLVVPGDAAGFVFITTLAAGITGLVVGAWRHLKNGL